MLLKLHWSGVLKHGKVNDRLICKEGKTFFPLNDEAATNEIAWSICRANIQKKPFLVSMTDELAKREPLSRHRRPKEGIP